MCVSRTFQDHLCPFSMSFRDCLIKRISNKSDFHIHVLNQLPCADSLIYTVESNQNVESKQQSVEFRTEKYGVKHVHGSEMQQPFGLFSMTFQDLRLTP